MYLRDIPWVKDHTIQKLIASLLSLQLVTIHVKGEPCDSQPEAAFLRFLRVALHNCPIKIRVLCAQVYDFPMRELFKIPQATSLAFEAPRPRAFGVYRRGPPVRETQAEHLADLSGGRLAEHDETRSGLQCHLQPARPWSNRRTLPKTVELDSVARGLRVPEAACTYFAGVEKDASYPACSSRKSLFSQVSRGLSVCTSGF